jgi:hypothetical protein
MKRIFTLCIVLCTVLTGFAQADTTGRQSDTIKVGTMIIIRKPGYNDGESNRDKHIIISNNNRHYKPSNISTNWIILDLGFVNYNDKTNYADALASGFIRDASIGKDALKLRTTKAVNVNIWLFMQRLNLIQHVVNLKYGFGLELNNYYYDDKTIRYHKNPTYIDIDSTLAGAKKNKLAADYITVPLMLNFNFTPHHGRGFGFSAGVSAGYLYSARQKIKIDNDRNKLHNDFDLERFKLSYVGELNLGPVRLYGSYAFKSMWSKGLDQTPYTLGLRFSNW